MKKITVIGMVKNSADIIESFIRCNAIWAERFVLLNNMSTDRTREILESLIEEGFSIEIIDDNEDSYCQSEKMNKLLRYTIDKYETDYVTVLDDDEILICDNPEKSVNEILEYLPDDNLYYAGWKMYIPTEVDDQSDYCIPRKMRFRLDDQLEIIKKIIIPVSIIDESFKIAQGNHFAFGDRINNHVNIVALRIAHFPIRSAEQLKSKALIGWTNYMLMDNRSISHGTHWKGFYDVVKEGKELTIDAMQLMVLAYYSSWEADKVNIIVDPVELNEKCFKMGYTGPREINSIKNYINHVEKIIKNIKDVK